MSSVQLVDEAAAERQRGELINRLVQQALTADFDGAWVVGEGRQWNDGGGVPLGGYAGQEPHVGRLCRWGWRVTRRARSPSPALLQ
mgnify:CR=1 FL=1